MTHILSTLNKLGWNRRALTERDFFRICKRERIRVVEEPMEIDGVFALVGKTKFIFINSGLRGLRRLHVMFHELSHYFLHQPVIAFFHVGIDERPSKQEVEADAMAAVALMPLKDLMQIDLFDEYPDDTFAARLIQERWALYVHYGI